ncbi:MAG TPA: hypothetical protein VJ909_00600, partial [Prolixibacteraceae bacterium]|nr:hypothetical protein [Prolixibacteraceae bacterium]
GFAYRYVPIRNQPDKQQNINTDKLYQNFVHHFQWGNLGSPGIFIGENIRNTIHSANIKSNFHHLALSLSIRKQEVKAIETIDKLYNILPLKRYETTPDDVALATVYYHLQQNDKADRVIEEFANDRLDNIQFYLSMGNRYIDSFQQQKEKEKRVLNEALSLLEKNQRTELSAIIEKKFEHIINTN